VGVPNTCPIESMKRNSQVLSVSQGQSSIDFSTIDEIHSNRGAMGFFQDLNREFEGQLVEDIASRLSSHHGITPTIGSTPCHQGKGSYHTKMMIEIKSHGATIEFHYCGGMGYGLLVGNTDWFPGDWLMTTKNQAAHRIAEFVAHLNSDLD
jgi:hypothetical protein